MISCNSKAIHKQQIELVAYMVIVVDNETRCGSGMRLIVCVVGLVVHGGS